MNKPVIIPSSNELNVSVPKKRLKSQQVKKLTEEWSIEDSNYRVSLEISHRDATCANCMCNTKVSGYRRKIKKGTPRYRVARKTGYYTRTDFYHRSCIPSKVRKFIKDYSKRDIPKEEMNTSYNHIIRILEITDEEVIGTKYKKQLFKKLRKYLDDNN